MGPVAVTAPPQDSHCGLQNQASVRMNFKRTRYQRLPSFASPGKATFPPASPSEPATRGAIPDVLSVSRPCPGDAPEAQANESQ
jgi:hypothetical protein